MKLQEQLEKVQKDLEKVEERRKELQKKEELCFKVLIGNRW